MWKCILTYQDLIALAIYAIVSKMAVRIASSTERICWGESPPQSFFFFFKDWEPHFSKSWKFQMSGHLLWLPILKEISQIYKGKAVLAMVAMKFKHLSGGGAERESQWSEHTPSNELGVATLCFNTERRKLGEREILYSIWFYRIQES